MIISFVHGISLQNRCNRKACMKNYLGSELLVDQTLRDVFVTDFKRNGYARIDSMLNLDEVGNYRQLILDIHEKKRFDLSQKKEKDFDYNYYNFTGVHYFNLNRRYRELDPLIAHPLVIKTLEEMMGVPCILSQTELRNPAKESHDNAYNLHTDARVPAEEDFWIIVFWAPQ